ncbi:hypothetical protein GUJ93_ZPchr0013g35231 [Zizania palustris]|uniref:Uncharacterized protein n=1 Tax=Zizania palustris TaxID=103762 RepID=A0A8J6BUU2_ZIZPA|nr:hypothetical protein GUJ93_ZPchr0013g35231 [Zizania palustris]
MVRLGSEGVSAAAAITVVLPAVMNWVLYKTAYHAGIVTKETLAQPKSRFMLIGLLEALGVASGMAAAAMLSGPSIPELPQGKRPDKFVVNSFGSGFKVNQKKCQLYKLKKAIREFLHHLLLIEIERSLLTSYNGNKLRWLYCTERNFKHNHRRNIAVA